MSKAKAKVVLFAVLSVIGLITGFFFSGYINMLLSGGNIDDISTLRPALIMASIITNERHRMLTLCVELVIVAGIGALMLMSRKETFESDTTAVAGDIKTPIAIGQGQHGTARWLNKAEQRKEFSLYRLDKDERIFAALLIAGARDRREVKNYKGDIDTPTTAAAANDALAVAAAGDGCAQSDTSVEDEDAEQNE